MSDEKNLKKTQIKIGIKTNDIRDEILSENLYLAWKWIEKNTPKFKSIKFKLGEWTREDYPFDTNTNLIIEVEEDS